MFIGDLRGDGLRVPSARSWAIIAVALIAVALVGLQVAASIAGFQGPLHSLISDYVATPKSATLPWAGLGLAMLGLPNRYRISALLAAGLLDVVFAVARLSLGGVLALGNGPTIVLTGLALYVLLRWTGAGRSTALRGIAFGILLIVATKAGDTWNRITAIIRPTVLDEYALLADHALAQPSWLVGRVVDAAGPVLQGLLHWVYIELPVAAMVVAVYQLRHVTTHGWPRHFVVRTFLVLGLIGPIIYLLFPVVGPVFAFGAAGAGFQVGDYWPGVLPPVDMSSPAPIDFDSETARNCMPSMHTAWALAVFIHSRRGPRWLRWGGTAWLAGTLTATLGFGYHYAVDLVAGAILCLTVEAALREPVRDRGWARMPLVVGGTALLTVLLLGCRYLAGLMAQHPVIFGPLIIASLAVLSTAFYATFFSRTGNRIPWWGVSTLQRAAAQSDQRQPEFG